MINCWGLNLSLRLTLAVLFLGLLGCGKQASVNHKDISETKIFLDSDNSTGPSSSQFEISLQPNSFAENQESKNLSKLGRDIKQIRIEFKNNEPSQKLLTINLSGQLLLFYFSSGFQQGHDFTAFNDLRDFRVKGICSGDLCEKARFEFEQVKDGTISSVQYLRTTEYLKLDDLRQLSTKKESDILLKEAVEFGFPVTRHSSRIDQIKNLDLLVIERPQVTEDDPADRVELDASQLEPRVTPTNRPAEPTRPRMTLTRNPFEAYGIELPQRLFRPGAVISSADSLQHALPIIKPVSLQSDFEPAYRMSAIAEAMVDQRVRIYRNACNIFVRATMALAGYLNGPWPLANDFENLFYVQSDGLSNWETIGFDNSRFQEKNQNLVETALRNLADDHAIVLQVERKSRYGHVGMLSKKNGRLYFFDASLDNTKRGTVRRKVDVEELMKEYPGLWRVKTYPKILGVAPETRRKT